MDYQMIFTFAVGFVALCIAVFLAVRSGGTLTLETVTDKLSDIEITAGAAKHWVLAAEQLWETGQLDKDERFDYVLKKLSLIYPDIDEDTLEGSIEAAVKWMKLLGFGKEAQ